MDISSIEQILIENAENVELKNGSIILVVKANKFIRVAEDIIMQDNNE